MGGVDLDSVGDEQLGKDDMRILIVGGGQTGSHLAERTERQP